MAPCWRLAPPAEGELRDNTAPLGRTRATTANEAVAKSEVDRMVALNAPQAAAGALSEPMPAPLAAARQMASADQQAQPGYHDQGRDQFETIETNPLKVTAEEPVSTFSIDVDTASYSFMRASLSNGVLPQDDAVRVEELINYFPYDYPAPETREEPFKSTVTVMQTPWNPATKLVHIGIKGFEIQAAERPKANLVFLIDTSGSMDEPNKLPLLINSMKLLVERAFARRHRVDRRLCRQRRHGARADQGLRQGQDRRGARKPLAPAARRPARKASGRPISSPSGASMPAASTA